MLAMQQQAEQRRIIAEQQLAQREEQKRLDEEKQEEELKAALESQREIDNARYQQVKDRFVQQTDPVYDRYGTRWVQCEICGEIKKSTDFPFYGGANHVNLGQCAICIKNR